MKFSTKAALFAAAASVGSSLLAPAAQAGIIASSKAQTSSQPQAEPLIRLA